MGLNDQLKRLERATAPPPKAFMHNGFDSHAELNADIREAMAAGAEWYVMHATPNDTGKAYPPYLLLAIDGPDELSKEEFERESQRYDELYPMPTIDIESDPRRPYRPGPWPGQH